LKRRNEIEQGKGKYLLLLESLQVSGRKREKQRIELEVQNEKLDPEDENVIPNGMENFRNGLGKPEWMKQARHGNHLKTSKGPMTKRLMYFFIDLKWQNHR
jgi:hypothetical protein